MITPNCEPFVPSDAPLISPRRVVVGRKYLVPCIIRGGEIVPVMLPAHEDGPEDCSAPTASHYHVDYRFTRHLREDRPAAWYAEHYKPVMQQLRCYRNSTFLRSYYLHSLVRLHTRFADSSLKNGACPHRGVRVTNTCGTCPAHGLMWNLETGRLKFLPPFTVVLPEESGKAVIDTQLPISITLQKQLVIYGQSIDVKLLDATGQEYPHTVKVFREDPLVRTLVPGDTLVLRDSSCHPESST